MAEAVVGNGDMDALGLFRAGIKTEVTRKTYEPLLRRFLSFVGMDADAFAERARAEPKWAEGRLLAYIAGMKEQGYAPQSMRTYTAPILLFLEMNDITGLNIKRVKKTFPVGTKATADRAYTIEEVRALAGSDDYRVRVGTLFLFTSGMRLGGLEGMTVGDVEPVKRNGEAIAAWVKVYRGAPEEYRTLVSGEALRAMESYLSHRRENGERVGASSPLLRNLYSPKKAGANVVPLRANNLQSLLLARLRKLRLRGEKNGGERYEVAVSHGFRKAYKSVCEAAGAKSIAIEVLMGHSIGVSGAYYRPAPGELLKEYEKCLPRLSVLTPRAGPEVTEEMEAMKKRLAELEARAAASAPAKSAIAEILSDPDVLEVVARKVAARSA